MVTSVGWQLSMEIFSSMSRKRYSAICTKLSSVRRLGALASIAIVTCVLLVPTIGNAQTAAVQAAPAKYDSRTTELPASIIERGVVLEKNAQWGEALSLYQQATRDYPDNESIKTRRSVARIHFDLDRRYSDTSFLKTINTVDVNTSANVYAEVLLKVQSYYVDQPNWADLASYGLTSLEVALMSPEFRTNNLPNISEA